MTKHAKDITCWIITEGIAGTENQCTGIAEALGVEPEIKRIHLTWPWNLLSPYLGFEKPGTFLPALEPPWPDLLIASGRKSIAAARYIKRKSGGITFTVQVQNPRVNPAEFDLVVIPAHDRLEGDNVITTIATPNRITAGKLAKAKSDFTHLSRIREPRIAVLLGGNSKNYMITRSIIEQLAVQLAKLDAGLMITASRRTGEDNINVLREALKGTDAFIWDGSGDNPYFGFLAWANYILVTADSASMLSEAASTGKPVYLIPLEGGSPKFDRLHNKLIEHGSVRPFEGRLESWTYEPLADAGLVAGVIRHKLPGWTCTPQAPIPENQKKDMNDE